MGVKRVVWLLVLTLFPCTGNVLLPSPVGAVPVTTLDERPSRFERDRSTLRTGKIRSGRTRSPYTETLVIIPCAEAPSTTASTTTASTVLRGKRSRALGSIAVRGNTSVTADDRKNRSRRRGPTASPTGTGVTPPTPCIDAVIDTGAGSEPLEQGLDSVSTELVEQSPDSVSTQFVGNYDFENGVAIDVSSLTNGDLPSFIPPEVIDLETPNVQPQDVPEPAILGAFSAGLVTIMWARRRRRR